MATYISKGMLQGLGLHSRFVWILQGIDWCFQAFSEMQIPVEPPEGFFATQL